MGLFASGDWIMTYLAGGSPVSMRMDRITVGARVAAAWVDPTSGKETPIGVFPNEGVRSFSPPEGWQDAVLRLAEA